ncbi:MAG: acetate--CoA ligase [Nitrosopumilus sp.]|nr:acetate--CoA ligase [Nitrosopumilus sp.]
MPGWGEEAGRLKWSRRWDAELEWDPPAARWFAGGQINASYNALDVQDPSRTAIIWEGEDGSVRRITYGWLLDQTSRLAGGLLSMGVGRGDRVAIYLPMIPELPAAMLACARIGAVHTVVFSGLGAASLRSRIADSGARVLVTADAGYRRGGRIRLKEAADEAVRGTGVRTIVVRRTGDASLGPGDTWWDDLVSGSAPADPVPLESCHPLFILYTSGTTGMPKGILHGTGGYLVHACSTFRLAFGTRPGDIYWCTADPGWVTGHSYVVYAPLCCGATQVMYEGAPDHPDASRMWQVAERHGVTILYTTPTAIRMQMASGILPGSHDLSALRLLGSVGEPLGAPAWAWYRDEVGGGRCPVIDTWWQTETGGMMVVDPPGGGTPEPGYAGRPVPGIDVRVVDDGGRPAPDGERGRIVVSGTWPGMMIGVWGSEERYASYWSGDPPVYQAGDYAVRDAEGRIRILGRADDVLNVAGHRIGTAEIEACAASHPGVAEAAACGVPDPVRGQSIAVFAVPRGGGFEPGEIRSLVRRDVGPVASPRIVCSVPRLPKTRSGKIMRRILGALAAGSDPGDTSTLEDPGAVEDAARALRGA